MRQVSQRFGTHRVLADVTLAFGPGLHVVLGANGAGKSTLLKIMATVLTPTQGRVGFDRWEFPRDVAHLRANVGYVPQGAHLDHHLTARDWVAAAAVQRGLGSWRAAASVAEDLLETLGVAAQDPVSLTRAPGRVQQWAMVAQSLLGAPPVWILDEPTERLPPRDQERLGTLLLERSQSATVIVAMHVGPAVMGRAGRVVVIADGAVLADGSPEAVAAAGAGQVRLTHWPVDLWDRAGESWLAALPLAGAAATAIYPAEDRVAVRVVGPVPVPPDVTEELAVPTVEDGHQALVLARRRVVSR